jgi:hypothetical protein
LPLLLLLLVDPVSCMQTASTVIPVRFPFLEDTPFDLAR